MLIVHDDGGGGGNDEGLRPSSRFAVSEYRGIVTAPSLQYLSRFLSLVALYLPSNLDSSLCHLCSVASIKI